MDSRPVIRVRAFERPDPALLAELAEAHSADLANALGASAIADPELRPVWRPARVLGAALTVGLPQADNLTAIYAALNAQPGDVLVVEAPAQSTGAIVGGVIGGAAKAHGVAGIIVDGAVRDTVDLEAMRLPVWSRRICPRQATKVHGGSVGYAITCGGVQVEAGDIVLADDDGIAFVSPARLRDSIAAVKRGLTNEKELQDGRALEAALQRLVAAAQIERDG
jgi:4-hydroxy-4-methyl-2-oxoglutarate aldolase